MASTLKPALKPDLTLDYQRNDFKSLEDHLRDLKESKELKFGFPTPLNLLKRLIEKFILFIVQKKTTNETANNKLISSFNALNSIRESNSFVQSKMKEVKSIALEYLNRQKTNRDKLQEKLKINSINSKEMKNKKEAVMKLSDMLNEITEKSLLEHETKLQKSYAILKMQPFGSDESKEYFQNRLIDSVIDARINAKNIFIADSVKTNKVLADIDDAYKYLRNYATLRPNVGGACDNEQNDDENKSLIKTFHHR